MAQRVRQRHKTGDIDKRIGFKRGCYLLVEPLVLVQLARFYSDQGIRFSLDNVLSRVPPLN